METRDLMEELYQGLRRYDIDLYLYFTGDDPYKEEEIGVKFGFVEPRQNVTMDFVEKWSSVLREYSLRYGDKVKGWWLDGMYRQEFGYTQQLLAPYYRAVKEGNPEGIVSFNDGIKPYFYRYYAEEEYTTGEQNDLSLVPTARFHDGAQAHVL
ncbi:MAG: hypothetical protein E7541_04630, partial [Ruminococcaceae bacterium]|nr:hypothetical protein [Oscillospiraceae bacterium]